MAGLLQPYIPDASDWFSSAAKGYELGNTQRERDVLLEAGKAAAGGNMPMARRALYAGGNFAQARAIDAHSASLAAQTRAASNDQLARALKVQGALADVAHSINTPEEFEAAKATLGKAGLDVSKYNFGDLPALRAQALDVKTRLELALKEKAASAKTQLGELEKGYRWRMSPDGQLELDPTGRPIAEPIPGGKGEAISSETAARVGLADKFLRNAERLKARIRGKGGAFKGAGGWWNYYTKSGEGGDVLRELKSGRDALLRNLTGAGMNMSEAEEYADRYLPGTFDTEETILNKINGLESDLQAVAQRVLVGRGKASTDMPTERQRPPALSTPNRLRFNPETGELEQVR